MKNLVSIVLTIFGCLFLLLIVVSLFEGRKYEKQVSGIIHCDLDHKAKAVRFAEFSFDVKREILFKDSIKIMQIRKYVCNSKPRYIADRVGAIESCNMYIEFENEIITLTLYKDDRDFCRIVYSPGISKLLNLQSIDLAFVFNK